VLPPVFAAAAIVGLAALGVYRLVRGSRGAAGD
jgi:hypothetical protein